MPTTISDFTSTAAQQAIALDGNVYTPPVVQDGKTDGLIVQALTQDIYYTLDGATDPNPSAVPPIGYLLKAGADPIRIPWRIKKQPRFKRATSGAVLEWMPCKNE